MFTRRTALLTGISFPMIFSNMAFSQSEETIQILDEDYPSLDISEVKPFGSYPPGAEAVRKAQELSDGAPNGDNPLRIVRYFIDAGRKDPDLIAQAPKSKAWNPLILEFFEATDYKAVNDMVPWCSAFANWVLKRAGKGTSGSAASQSFLQKKFQKVDDPKIGDLAVFTCYSIDTGKSLGLGHVTFVASKPKDGKILVAGGNQSNDGRSLICEKYYPLGPVRSSRTIDGKKVPVDFKINSYISL